MNHSYPLPRGPVLGWASFTGSRSTALPSVQDLPHVVLTSSGRAAIFQALLLRRLAGSGSAAIPLGSNLTGDANRSSQQL